MTLTDDIVAAAVPPGTLLVWWLGQGGFAFKNPLGKVMFCARCLCDSVAAPDGPDWGRLFLPPILPAEAVVDVVICTQDHPDHADPQTILGLSVADPRCILGGPGSVGLLARRWALPQGNMPPYHTAQLAAEVDASPLILCHYGLFRLNTLDPGEFVGEMASQGLKGRVVLPEVGVPISLRAAARQSQGVWQ